MIGDCCVMRGSGEGSLWGGRVVSRVDAEPGLPPSAMKFLDWWGITIPCASPLLHVYSSGIFLAMNAIRKKIVVDDRGNPREVIISWAQFCEMSEALGLDLDEKAKLDLRAARRDLKRGKTNAFKPLSAL